MADKVQICNLALIRLSATRITSLTDNTIEAKQCSAIYELIAEQVMSLGPWPSVIRRTALSQLTTTPAYEYKYEYQLPTDPKFLRLLEINENKVGDIPHTVENGKLLVNESIVKIRYISYITDSESYDIYLRQAIADHLVAELTYATTGQIALYKKSLEYAQEHSKELLSQCSLQTSAQDVNSDTFIDARSSIWPSEGRTNL